LCEGDKPLVTGKRIGLYTVAKYYRLLQLSSLAIPERPGDFKGYVGHFEAKFQLKG